MRVYINILFTAAVSLARSLECKLWQMCTFISALIRVGWAGLQRGGARILRHHQQQESNQSDVEKTVSRLALFEACSLLCVLVILVRLQTLNPQTLRSANAQSASTWSANTWSANTWSANTWSANKVFIHDVIISFLNGAPYGRSWNRNILLSLLYPAHKWRWKE